MNVLNFIKKYYLVIIGLIIYISFFVSARGPYFYDYFFSGSNLHHCCRGLDFYQVPNGYYGYTIGGKDFSGQLPSGIEQYSQGFPSNYNVYHPFFTFLVGGFLVKFSPYDSFYIWMYIKLVISLLLFAYAFKKFKDYKYFNFAAFLLLINSAQYLEIRLSQYQFIFNVFFLLLLIYLVEKKDSVKGSLYYFGTLLTKPIGILWFPVLIFKRQYKIAILGLILFVYVTMIYKIDGSGSYYFDNLINHFLRPIQSGPIQILTLDAFLRHVTHTSEGVIKTIRLLTLGAILFLTMFRRVNIYKSIFLMCIYFFLFYDLVYEYHYSLLAPLLFVSTLVCKEFQTKSARLLSLLISLPTIFFILRFLKIGFYDDPFLGPDPNLLGWKISVINKILPLIILAILVLKNDVKGIFQDMKLITNRLKELNSKYEILG